MVDDRTNQITTLLRLEAVIAYMEYVAGRELLDELTEGLPASLVSIQILEVIDASKSDRLAALGILGALWSANIQAKNDYIKTRTYQQIVKH